MSFLASSLASVLFVITTLFFYVLISIFSTTASSFAATSNLIGLPGLSLSTSYLGDRILEYKDVNDVLYLNIKKENYSSFVYAK